eukprot:2687696-Prorocentrum_lima.AAC.1
MWVGFKVDTQLLSIPVAEVAVQGEDVGQGGTVKPEDFQGPNAIAAATPVLTPPHGRGENGSDGTQLCRLQRRTKLWHETSCTEAAGGGSCHLPSEQDPTELMGVSNSS